MVNTLQLRHFVATTPDAERTNETVMRIVEGKITDFGKYEDISEFFLGSKSKEEHETEKSRALESREDGADNDNVLDFEEVAPRGLAHPGARKQTKTKKKKVTLHELGPRITMQLIKIEEKVFEGEVHYHKFIKKTEEEIAAARAQREKREKAKEKRREEQERNVLIKKGLAAPHQSEAGDEEDSYAAMISQEEDSAGDDAAWYRKEVGQEPDRETLDILNASTQNAARSTFQSKNTMKKKEQKSKNTTNNNNSPKAKEKHHQKNKNSKSKNDKNSSNEKKRKDRPSSKDYNTKPQKFQKRKD